MKHQESAKSYYFNVGKEKSCRFQNRDKTSHAERSRSRFVLYEFWIILVDFQSLSYEPTPVLAPSTEGNYPPPAPPRRGVPTLTAIAKQNPLSGRGWSG